MSADLSRRELLAAALAGAAASAWPLPSRSEGNQPLTATPLPPGLAVIGHAGANVTVLAGPQGALLVDGGLAKRTDEVLSVVKAFNGSAAVALLFDTSWRPEHTGANERLRAAGATIIAHSNTKRWMAETFDVPWEHRKHTAQPAAALPNETFARNGSIQFAGQRIAYGHLPHAHTDGDIYVRFGQANVLAVGELLAVDRYPVVDYVTGGSIAGLRRATGKLLQIADEKTRIVPARGPVQERAALEDQLDLCSTVLQAVRHARRRGHSLREFVASKPTAAFDAKRGDPSLFLRLVYESAAQEGG